MSPDSAATFIRDALPPGGLFSDQTWRISPTPFALGADLAKELETFGRVLLQFYRAVNLLYRQSVAGKQPAWIAELLDQGKPAELVELQRSNAFKNDVPRVLRPDCLLTESGFAISELDSVPGGIGLTAWLNQTYSKLGAKVIGGERGMMDGFAGIFGDVKQVHLVVSEEAGSYRPEMEWLAAQLNGAERSTFNVQRSRSSPMAMRFIVSSSCSISRMSRRRKPSSQPRRRNASASRLRPNRSSRRNCCWLCCGTGTCARSGGRNSAKVFSTGC